MTIQKRWLTLLALLTSFASSLLTHYIETGSIAIAPAQSQITQVGSSS